MSRFFQPPRALPPEEPKKGASLFVSHNAIFSGKISVSATFYIDKNVADFSITPSASSNLIDMSGLKRQRSNVPIQ
jgi:hypothetical protein